MCIAAGRWYYGKVTAYNDATGEHEVTYDDLEVKNYLLTSRAFFLLKDTATPAHLGDPPLRVDVLPMTVRLPPLVGVDPSAEGVVDGVQAADGGDADGGADDGQRTGQQAGQGYDDGNMSDTDSVEAQGPNQRDDQPYNDPNDIDD